VPVRKKVNSFGFCIDYRQLKRVNVQESYPIPLIDNCLNALRGFSCFSNLDLRTGYCNIPIADNAWRLQPLHGHALRFNRSCSSCSLFQRLMDFVLFGLSYTTCLVYLDDIIIFGKSFEEQLARLREVFSQITCSSENLNLKPSKCSLFRRSVSFLGHIVSEQGMAMQTKKIQAIRD